MPKSGKKPEGPVLRINSDVVRQIRRHARSGGKTEVCGVLIGREENGIIKVEACIAGVNATQGGTHVTFTQDTWEHIYRIKDRNYPNDRIVGWYHSHPGFGVFLSDHDMFIHKNFFSSPQQVAWVYDPHADEEACFGWVGERLERLSQVSLVDRKGGEGAGESGKPEPSIRDIEEDNLSARDACRQDASRPQSSSLRIVGTIFSYLSVFLLGILVAWYIFPRVVVMPVPVDPRTGQPVTLSPPAQTSDTSQRPDDRIKVPSAPQPSPASTKGSNGQRQ